MSISPGARSADGASEFVVAMSRADVIHQYEQACLMAGAHAGLVDLSTFGVINSILASASAPAGGPPASSGSTRATSSVDWLLVHVTTAYLTLAVVRDNALLFFRNRSEEAEGTLADLIHQTAMYYEDRLSGSGFSRVLFCGGTTGAARPSIEVEQLRRSLAERLGTPVEPIDPRTAAVLDERIVGTLALLDTVAPLVGLLVRDRKTAA